MGVKGSGSRYRQVLKGGGVSVISEIKVAVCDKFKLDGMFV